MTASAGGRNRGRPRPRSPACGAAGRGRSAAPDDLEGYAQLCPDCLGKAGDNEFLRFRLRAALEARAGGGRRQARGDARSDPDDRRTARWSRTTRRGPASTTTGTSAAAATRTARSTTRPGTRSSMPPATWLDGLPIGGRIVELAAGTGWWSPLLAGKGELWMSDAVAGAAGASPRAAARARPRAHLHVRDAWAEPDGEPAGALFAGFWLSHVERERTAAFLALAKRWLCPGRAPCAHRLVAGSRNRARSIMRRRLRRPGPLAAPARRRSRVHDRQGVPHASRDRGRAAGRRVPGRGRHDDRALLRPRDWRSAMKQ